MIGPAEKVGGQEALIVVTLDKHDYGWGLIRAAKKKLMV